MAMILFDAKIDKDSVKEIIPNIREELLHSKII